MLSLRASSTKASEAAGFLHFRTVRKERNPVAEYSKEALDPSELGVWCCWQWEESQQRKTSQYQARIASGDSSFRKLWT